MTRHMLGVRDQRALLLGAVTMLGLVMAFRGLPAWRAWRAEARAAAAETMSQAAKADALLASFSESLDTLEARTARVLEMGPALVTGDTPAEAASILASLVAELARQSLVRLDAVDIRVDTSRTHTLPRVALNVQATADIAGLSALLHGLENGPTLLAVRQLAIRPQSTDGPAEQVEQLAIRLTAEGLALVRPPEDTP